MVLSMTISGALAGLAGVTYYLGYVGSIQPKVLISTGFDAIAVSLLGNNNPFGIVFSTMLITLISKGSTYMKSAAGVDATFSFTSCTRTNIHPFWTPNMVVTSVPSTLSVTGRSSVSPMTDLRLHPNSRG